MHIFKKIFTILAIIFGSLGLMNIVSTDVALPLMYFFMGLTLLHMAHLNGRVCGAKRPKCEAERSHHL